jgi:hypothetical protein
MTESQPPGESRGRIIGRPVGGSKPEERAALGYISSAKERHVPGQGDMLSGKAARRTVDGALGLALVATVLVVTREYVAAERCFYYWDHASYHRLAVETATAFWKSWASGWGVLQQSFHTNYNAVFALPLVPWILHFGPSRLSFETGLALVYLVPLPLAMGALATRLVPGRRRLAFWGAVAFAVLTPMTWVPTLRGFPDAGGAALMAVAGFLYLGDPTLRDRRTMLALGVLLGLSVLFRRHFAYGVMVFLLSIALQALATVAQRRPLDAARVRGLLAFGLRLGTVCGLSVAVLFALGWSYALRFLVYDFHALYRPYEEPLQSVLAWYVAPYGWVALVASAAGFLAGFRAEGVDRFALAFVLLSGLVSVGQWCLWVRQIGEPYTVHFTTPIVLGLLVLCWAFERHLRPRWRAVPLGAVVGLSLLGLILGLSTPDVGAHSPLRPLFPSRWSPLKRYDYGEILRLVRTIDGRARAGDGVFVVASSDTLNADIVRQADLVLAGRREAKLAVLASPDVDSVGFYPLGELLEARFVIVVQPFQAHLAPEDQRMLRTLYDTFLDHGPIAQDFVESPLLYDLERSTGYVYERKRPTTMPTALATLASLERAMPQRPGGQSAWAVVDYRYPSWLSRNDDGSAAWVAHPAPRREPPWTTLATLDPPSAAPEIDGTLGFVDPRCRGVALSLSRMTDEGALETLAEVRRRPADDIAFRLNAGATKADRLFLSLFEHSEGEPIEHCQVRIDGLVVR